MQFQHKSTNLVVKYGVVDPESGEMKDKNVNLADINANLTAEQLYQVAKTLMDLTQYPLRGIERVSRDAII